MLADYQMLRDGGQRVRLRIGAWHHASRGLARQRCADAFDWFGTHLLGRHPVSWPAPASGWRSWAAAAGATWPSGRRRASRPALAPAAGRRAGAGRPGRSDPDRYIYDPADPTPAVGGTSLMQLRPGDNRALEQRPDVLTYTSAPLDPPLVIAGPVTAELFVGSSRPHTDFFARLCDVDPDGRSVNITDGILRLTGATEAPQPVTIDLWPTAHQFRPGHRIRLQVSSGAHPRYARNPGSGEPLATASHAAHRAAGGLPRPGAPVRRRPPLSLHRSASSVTLGNRSCGIRLSRWPHLRRSC